MRAITLYQPWASLIADGRKTFETRSWKPPVTAQYVAIHAGRPDTVDVEYSIECGYRPSSLVTGAIIAVARLVGYVQTERVVAIIEGSMPAAQAAEELRHGDYRPGRYAWELDDVRRVPAIPIRGAQGLWDVPEDVAIRLRLDSGLAGR